MNDQYAQDLEAYAAYRNGLAAARENLSPEELAEFEEDLAKAEAKMMDSYYGVAA